MTTSRNPAFDKRQIKVTKLSISDTIFSVTQDDGTYVGDHSTLESSRKSIDHDGRIRLDSQLTEENSLTTHVERYVPNNQMESCDIIDVNVVAAAKEVDSDISFEEGNNNDNDQRVNGVVDFQTTRHHISDHKHEDLDGMKLPESLIVEATFCTKSLRVKADYGPNNLPCKDYAAVLALRAELQDDYHYDKELIKTLLLKNFDYLCPTKGASSLVRSMFNKYLSIDPDAVHIYSNEFLSSCDGSLECQLVCCDERPEEVNIMFCRDKCHGQPTEDGIVGQSVKYDTVIYIRNMFCAYGAIPPETRMLAYFEQHFPSQITDSLYVMFGVVDNSDVFRLYLLDSEKDEDGYIYEERLIQRADEIRELIKHGRIL